MILRDTKPNLLTLLFGILLAFLAATAPHIAKAQDVCDIQGANGAGSSGTFYTDMANSMHEEMQKKTLAKQDVWKNSPTLDIKLHYCHDLITQFMSYMGALTNPKTAIINLIFNNILMAFLNSLCQQVLGLITQVVSQLKVSVFNAICLPLPKLHLGLNLPHFSGGCTGMPLLTVSPTIQTNAPGTKSNWQIWVTTPWKTYVPKGP